MVAPPFSVAIPENVLVPRTLKLLLMVVVPVVAPREIVVASPPMFNVCTVVFKRLKLPWLVVMFPPLTARFAPAVTFPVKREVESTVNVPLVWIAPVFEIDTPVVPYPPPIDKESKEASEDVPLIAVAKGKEIVALLMVAVPDVAPRVKVVAAPPIERLVVVVLNKAAVVLVVVMFPPFMAILPAVVMFPEDPAILKLVRLMFPVVPVISFAPSDKALTISGSERSMALVIPPFEDCILIPEDSASLVSRLSSNRSWEGRVVLSPSARDR